MTDPSESLSDPEDENDAAAPPDQDSPTAPARRSKAIDAAADQELAATVEAILFASDTPLPAQRIAQVAELPGVAAVKRAIRALNERYEQAGSAFRIEAIAGGYQMLTLSQYHDVLGRLFKARSESRLSQAAMETLAIIAYRQPILRADIEAIRGVASGEVIRTLLERQLVKIMGRAEVLGRPMLYGTTKRFLEVFGLSSLQDLPNVQELRSGSQTPPAKAPVPVPAEPAAQNGQAPVTGPQADSQPAPQGRQSAGDLAGPPEDTRVPSPAE